MDWLHRLERMMREGLLPDPRTQKGVAIYAALGIGIGMWVRAITWSGGWV